MSLSAALTTITTRTLVSRLVGCPALRTAPAAAAAAAFSSTTTIVARHDGVTTTRTRRMGQTQTADQVVMLFSTTTTSDKSPPPPPTSFVHPLSQIVLEHLQTSQPDFLTKHGLDRNMTLHKDGTFTLHFDDDQQGKIWTHYDPAEKKHWLTVQKGELVGQYMLQDNMKPAWHSDKRSTPEKIQDAVDEMIRKLSE